MDDALLLPTPFIFVDTQYFRNQKLDWNSTLFRALRDHIAAGRLRLLVTEITKREVSEQLRKSLEDLLTSWKKHDVAARQIGYDLTRIDKEAAIKRLTDEFEAFLVDCKAEVVPLSVVVDKVVDDYFTGNAPFGEGRKKSEFPDAFVIASLKSWCANKGRSICVVSHDSDFEKSCSADGPLFHFPGLPEIFSLVSSDQALRAALLAALSTNRAIADEITNCVDELRVIADQDTDAVMFDRAVECVSISELFVIERKVDKFIIEADVEFDATFAFELAPKSDTGSRSRRTSERSSNTYTVTVEIEADFDPKKPDVLEIESVHASLDEIDIELETSPPTKIRLWR